MALRSATVVVTGYDDRAGCGYVVSTGPDASVALTEAPTGAQTVTHSGVTVAATPEIAAALRDALVNRPVAMLSWSGPEVALTFEDPTLLGWLRHTVGGVLTVNGGPDPRA